MSDTSWIDRNEYPFASHYFETPAGKLHYVDEGKGQPVVMLHGNPTWSFLYRNLIKQLSPHYRCIAPDHIGFGLSDKPVDWSYLPEEHAKNLAALIEHLGLKDITLVVGDWGGPIGRFLIKKRNFFARTFMRAAFGDKSKLSAEAHRHYLRALPTAEDRKGSYVFPKQIITSSHWLKQIWDKVSVLRDKPALFVWGMKDVAFREKELQRWESALPNSHTVRLKTVGHFVQEEAPEELAQAVAAFLG
jgi:haloalkane dehalogenase